MNLPTVHCDSGCRGPKNMIFCVLLIALLVFGVNEATAADPAAVTETTTTFTPAEYCNDIDATNTVQKIIEECKYFTKGIKSRDGNYLFDITNVAEQDVNDFFATLSQPFDLNILMENNDIIKTLNFGGVTDFGFNTFTLKNNLNLMNIESKHKLEFGRNTKIVVRGNRYLTADAIAKLKTMARRNADADIQDVKECSQSSPIGFKDCERIYGDLVLTDFAQTQPPFYPRDISACLKLEKNSVDLDVPDFLKNLAITKDNCTTHTITGYCIMRKDLEKLKKKFNKVDIKNKDSCDYICDQKDIFAHLQRDCKSIRGDISITGTWNASQLELLKKVVTVHGSVTVDGVSPKETLTFFPVLQTINSSKSTGPALTIKNNKHTAEISLSALTKIISSAKPMLVYEKNGFNCSSDQRRILGLAMGTNVVICGGEKQPSPGARPRTRTNGTNGSNGNATNVVDPGQVGEKGTDTATEKEEGTNWLDIGLGLGLGIPGGILLLAGAITVIVLFVRKRNKKEDKTMKKKKKTPKSTTETVEDAPQEEIVVENRRVEVLVNGDEEVDPEIKANNDFDEKVQPMVVKMARSVFERKFGDTQIDGKKDSYEKFMLYIKNNKEFNTKVDKNKALAHFSKPNRKYVRFDDAVCFDEGRVKLTKFQDQLKTDFIHANVIDRGEFNGGYKFIATMHPLHDFANDKHKDDYVEKIKQDKTMNFPHRESTLNHFMTMLFETKAALVINLNGWESGMYLPPKAKRKMLTTMFEIETIKKKKIRNLGIQRTVKVTLLADSSVTFQFNHMTITRWPDKTVPAGGIYGFFMDLYSYLKKFIDNRDEQHIVVHCRAGVGRTCTLILAMHIAWNLEHNLPNAKDDFKIDIVEWFEKVRKMRHKGVQTADQFLALVAFQLEYCAKHLRDKERQKQCAEFGEKVNIFAPPIDCDAGETVVDTKKIDGLIECNEEVPTEDEDDEEQKKDEKAEGIVESKEGDKKAERKIPSKQDEKKTGRTMPSKQGEKQEERKKPSKKQSEKKELEKDV